MTIAEPRFEDSESAPRNSRFPGFYRLSPEERLNRIADFAGLSTNDLEPISDPEGLPSNVALCMSENVVGQFSLPLAFATNFRVNGADYIVPMAIEEPSVVAAASFAAGLLRAGEGISAQSTDSIMIGHIHFPDPPPEGVLERLVEEHQDTLKEHLDRNHPRLVAAGGGFRHARVRRLTNLKGKTIAVVHLHIDVRDAMGANAVNSMAEEAAPLFERWTGARVGLRILSNLPMHRRVKVEGRVPLSKEGGKTSLQFDVAEKIEEASHFAEIDPYRAVTANKGVMNGIDAVLLATGQDFRAVEAAAHAFASRDGRYTALCQWRVEGDELIGTMDIPLALGTVGGITGVHPIVATSLRILNIQQASRLAEVVASVGLAQNLAATRALASEGIQRGHMRLHARNIAMVAGAEPDEVPLVVSAMVARGRTDEGCAKECLEELRENGREA